MLKAITKTILYVLAPAKSLDKYYNGFDPEDIQMRGMYLEFNRIEDSLKFIPHIEGEVGIPVTYTGNYRAVLKYTLLEAPEGMKLDTDHSTPLLIWKPTPEQSGKSYTV